MSSHVIEKRKIIGDCPYLTHGGPNGDDPYSTYQ